MASNAMDLGSMFVGLELRSKPFTDGLSAALAGARGRKMGASGGAVRAQSETRANARHRCYGEDRRGGRRAALGGNLSAAAAARRLEVLSVTGPQAQSDCKNALETSSKGLQNRLKTSELGSYNLSGKGPARIR